MRDEIDTESGTATNNWLTNLRVSLMFLSRLPIPDVRRHPPNLASAMGAFPLAGLVIGLLGGLACTVAMGMGLPSTVSAVATVGFLAALTGGLHEDGLADVADGFGGGQSKERKLAIMKDSRIGTYGVLALVFAVLLKITALSAILQAGMGFLATIALFAGLGAWSRALCVALMATTPNARGGGIGAHAGAPGPEVNRMALGLGAGALGLLLWPAFGLWATLAAFASSCAAFWLVRRLALRQIGGHTGDVAGTMQIATEMVMLMSLVATI